ncbi:MAG: PfkB family carbohydrate kinase [Deltaproteobacteria bacterium]|nr:PfkB family carbohydrate kinase [Deltaproteobacteria bacterium]
MSVLIVGSMAVDTVEFAGTGESFEWAAGSAVFASLAASFFGTPRVVGVVGDDFPKSMMDALRERGAELDGVEIVEGGRTFRWHGRYAPDLASRESLATHLNVFETFSPKIPASFKDSRYLLLGNIHPALQHAVLDQVSGSELVAADTMNFWIHGERERLNALLPKIDLLIINEDESRDLSGERYISRIGKALLSMGPKRVIVKQGEYGAYLFDEHGLFHAPAYPVATVVDPTGAGDSFAGTLMGYLDAQPTLDRSALRRAVVMGSAAASLCVEKYGAKGLLETTRDEIVTRAREFASLVSTD